MIKFAYDFVCLFVIVVCIWQSYRRGFAASLVNFCGKVIALVGAWLLQHYVIVNAEVPSGSMKNTINESDRIIANRLAYSFGGEVERGDIIVFEFPDNEEILYVKRVIGLPGDIVFIKDGEVYINGTALNEPYIREKTEGEFGPYTVPEDCYFCLGDNRNDSSDSRYWNNTYVSKDKILGKVVLRYWRNFTWFEDPEY